MLDIEFQDKAAWRGADLDATEGRFTIPAKVEAEIIDVAKQLAANPFPLQALRPEHVSMPKAAAFMKDVSATLTEGVGFALIDRLPIEEIGEDGARAAHWLLSSMVERPVAQNWKGDLLYDVTDTGKKPGNGVRPDKTNAEQNFHTDNSYNLCPPNYVALLCLRAAKKGGMSHIVSFKTAHNILRERNPQLLQRLYEPFYFDRQREHAPGDELTTHHALFEADGQQLLARLSKNQVINGQALAEAPLDPVGAEALDALEEIMAAPGLDVSFKFQPGQIQIVNNRAIGHRRTNYEDWSEPEKKRLLVRLWLRDQGRPFYNG
jgi:alpha-ketoglutarate-dependent taurine dioxygenase